MFYVLGQSIPSQVLIGMLGQLCMDTFFMQGVCNDDCGNFSGHIARCVDLTAIAARYATPSAALNILPQLHLLRLQ